MTSSGFTPELGKKIQSASNMNTGQIRISENTNNTNAQINNGKVKAVLPWPSSINRRRCRHRQGPSRQPWMCHHVLKKRPEAAGDAASGLARGKC